MNKTTLAVMAAAAPCARSRELGVSMCSTTFSFGDIEVCCEERGNWVEVK